MLPELPLRTTVRDRIRREIVSGAIVPGARLVERNLAAELGVSRVPVREALRDLVAEGYAVDRATRGIAVRDYPAAEIDELFDIHEALEGVLLHRALADLSESGETKLRECLDDARCALNAGDQLAAVSANARFHEVLAEVAGGATLRGMLLGIRDRMRWLLRQHSNPAPIHAEHVALLDAITGGDRPGAERLLHQHLRTSRAALAEQSSGGRHMTRGRPSIAVVVLLTVLVGCSGGTTSASLPTDTADSSAAPAVATPTTVGASSSAAPPAVSTVPAAGPDPTTPDPTTPEAPPVATRNPALDGQLIDAAWANDVGLATQLIEAGADVNAKDSTVQSAYLIATSEGYLDLLELTLAHGADVASLDSYNGTGLIRAAERGHADIVGRLLWGGIEVSHVNRPGWTALDEAIVYGDGSQRYVDTVRALLAGGADPGRVAGDGRTPVQHAQASGHEVIAGTLRAAIGSPSMNQPDATAMLLDAAAEGDADRVAIALRSGAPLEARDDLGRTALLLAATNDRVDVARLLVVLGADPDAQDVQRDSAWLVTGVTGSVGMLEVLLPAHPDLTLRNRFGGVSVIPASERGHVDYVRRVVSTGIDLNHVNDLGWTAMLEAIVYGDGSEPYQQIIGILLDAGADPTIADAAGLTPLQHARSRGFTEIVARLQAAGG